jgi:hypothetical protein
MNTRTALLALSLLLTMLFAVPSFAADDEELKKDLTAVIALQGLPCGTVVAVVERGAMDYAASCMDGHKYRVYLNADGRVVVEPAEVTRLETPWKEWATAAAAAAIDASFGSVAFTSGTHPVCAIAQRPRSTSINIPSYRLS